MLWFDSMESCIPMEVTQTRDAEGGLKSVLTEGTAFMGAFTLKSSAGTQVADKDAPSTLWTLTTLSDKAPRFHQVIKRANENALYRVISEPLRTPGAASLQMAQVTLERWRT